MRLQTKIAPLKKCDTYKNVDRKCLKVTLGSRPKRNHFQVVVRAKNVDRKYFCYVKLLLWDQDQKMLRTIFKLSKTCRHQAENIFCYVKLLLWDQDQKNVGGTIFKLRLEQQAENIFVMSRLFWDQDHVGNHFQVLKKLKM